MDKKKPTIIDGIQCYSPHDATDDTDYPESGLENIYNNESKHFWFLSRSEFIARFFKKYTSTNNRIIEIGAGTGNVSRNLMNHGYKPAVGELYLSGLHYAKSYGIDECYQFNLYDIPFENEFDTAGLFDVLEHLSDPVKALNNIHNMLNENGLLFVTVPAHMWLWNIDDRLAGHKTRYTKKTIAKTIEKGGFEIIESRYFFISIIPLLFLRTIIKPDNKHKKNYTNDNTDIKINPILNTILLSICRIENSLNHFLPNVFGGSLLIVARKK